MTEPIPTEVQLSIKFGMNGSLYLIIKGPSVEAIVEEAGKAMDQARFLNSVGDAIQAELIVREQFEVETVSRTSEPEPSPYGPPPRMCAHGVAMKYQEGISTKTGNPYKGYFCTVKNDPRMAQCKSQFLN